MCVLAARVPRAWIIDYAFSPVRFGHVDLESLCVQPDGIAEPINSGLVGQVKAREVGTLSPRLLCSHFSAIACVGGRYRRGHDQI